MPAITLIGMEYLHLARLGLRSPDDRRIQNTSKIADALLQSQDMIGSPTFSLTQEFLSHMLGVRRNTVSVEAHTLQQAGLVRYARRKITILDRAGLEDCACECYSVIRAETDKLMGSV